VSSPATTSHPTTTAVPVSDLAELSVARLAPLWRHAAWLAAMFVVILMAIAVRLDVQQLHQDLDRNTRLQREARVLNERLRLELDARRRSVALEALAAALGIDPRVEVVRP
jgi:hypothetical protein